MNLKHRLRQIETDERRGHRIISVMKEAYPSYGTAVPETGDVHIITLAFGRLQTVDHRLDRRRIFRRGRRFGART